MSLQKTEAVILKTQRLGETSKILTLYSQKYGKIKVVAKGSRGLKSRYYGTLEPLNHIAIVYYFKETRELQLLSQADIVRPFMNIRADLVKYSIGSFCCELIDRTELEQPNKYIFRMLVDVLTAIDEAKGSIANYFFWFILRFLHISGFRPHFDLCRVCRSTTPQHEVIFSVIEGYFTCAHCGTSGSNSITLPARAIGFLQKLQHAPIKEVGSIKSVAARSCETLLMSFLQYHVEEAKFMKSLKFLKNIQSKGI